MAKKFCIVFIGVYLLFSADLGFAGNKKGDNRTAAQSMMQILDSINESIKNGFRLAELKLQDLERNFKNKGSRLHKETDKSVVENLQKMLEELGALEKIFKKNLTEVKTFSKEKLKGFGRKRDELEEKLDNIKTRIKEFAGDMDRELRSLEKPIRKKAQNILNELEMIIKRMQERLERQKQINESRSI